MQLSKHQKNTTIIVCHVTLFIICISTVGCSSQNRNIKAVIDKDKLLTDTILNSGYKDNMTLDKACDTHANNISRYVAQARRFDHKKLPKDFATAYQSHLHAWDNAGRVYANHLRFGGLVSNFAEGFFRGLLGDASGGYFKKETAVLNWQSQAQEAETRIAKTWYEVEVIALKYGVKSQ